MVLTLFIALSIEVQRDAELKGLTMNVADIMTENPVTIRKEATLFAALQAMEDVACHHLPVIGSEGHVIGIISDHDCRRALNWPYLWHERWQDDELVKKLTVGKVMTPAPIIIEPDAPAHEAARLMLYHNVRCLPVMRAETLIGIITTSDILMAFMNHAKRAETMPDSSNMHP
jgi:acetoin utilization protein AcuB